MALTIAFPSHPVCRMAHTWRRSVRKRQATSGSSVNSSRGVRRPAHQARRGISDQCKVRRTASEDLRLRQSSRDGGDPPTVSRPAQAINAPMPPPNTLLKRARSLAALHGHTLRNFTHSDRWSVSSCRTCCWLIRVENGHIRANWELCAKLNAPPPPVKRKVRRTPRCACVVELHAYAGQHPDRARKARWRANASPSEERGRVQSLPSPAARKKRGKRAAPS